MTIHCEPTSKRILIIGGGPAGLSTALWLHNLGLAPYVIEKEQALGGALRLNFLSNNWVLGQLGMTGVELANKFSEHIYAIKLNYRPGCALLEAWRDGQYWQVTLSCGGQLETQAFSNIVVATGTSFIGPEFLSRIPGSNTLLPQTVAFGPYAYEHMDAMAGKHVAIVGGGDNAFENAQQLLNLGAKVTLLVRSSPRAQRELLSIVRDHPACTLLQPANVIECSREAERIGLGLKIAEEVTRIVVDRLHVLVGYTPNTHFLTHLFEKDPTLKPALDHDGYLLTDSRGNTTIQGIYAAGDVCNREFPSVVSALAEGARVAKVIEANLRKQEPLS